MLIPLLIALVFNQLCEGFALGACLVGVRAHPSVLDPAVLACQFDFVCVCVCGAVDSGRGRGGG